MKVDITTTTQLLTLAIFQNFTQIRKLVIKGLQLFSVQFEVGY